MKQLTFLGLMVAAALLIAACGNAQSAAREQAQPETASQTAVESPAEIEPEPETNAVTEAATAADTEPTATGPADDPIAVEETASHSDDPTCSSALEVSGSVQFVPGIWTASGISRYVGPDIVDPDSGLATDFCQHSVEFSEIISGGPPPDGIPPLDNPPFDSIEAGDAWLADVQPVISLVVDGEAKAYPLAILTRHEIANDEIAGQPVAVTFCPLCNAGLVFNREVNGEVLRFGVSGNLRNSDLIMWDNKTLSWWQQFTGQAIVGEMTGTQLEFLPAQLVAWKDFKEAHPNGRVLSARGRNYGQNPYAGYDSSARPFLYDGEPDPRLRALERVLGYQSDDVARAYPLATISAEKVIHDTLDGREVVIFFEPGQVSALDNALIEQSKEVGSAAMFIPEVDGQQLIFRYEGGKIIDDETGSAWDIFGRAVAGELAGKQLEPVLSRVDFWFAWAAFNPNTELFGR